MLLMTTSKNHHMLQLFSIVYLGSDYRGRLTIAVKRMEALQAWRSWGAKALGYDDLGRLITAVRRKVVLLR
ncbi:hypothetical protein L195_g050549 [Trifolium pratense]|uniref:Uncharacterized protein n=1 Tax=Trifolium pratense TaxID=57577 RepID=A0A2K3JUL4_TRIPR|nr:hypothetical protein L195_g050549 [Trifolium pratense]